MTADGAADHATIGARLREARRSLAAAGFEAAGLEARLLLAHVRGCDMAALIGHPEHALTAEEDFRFAELVRRRLDHTPIALLLGEREFWSLPFRVSGDTLVPRPETETLVEAALAWRGARARPVLRVLDLGTGSGCLLLALLHALPEALGVGVDRSPAALCVARDNARRLGLAGRAAFVAADWTRAIDGRFDLVLSNPPYITDTDWPTLPADVRLHEPALALRGGADGLAAYRDILADLGRVLAEGAAAFLEVDRTTAGGVAALAGAHGLHAVELRTDLSGCPRCMQLRASDCVIAKKELGNQIFPD